MSHTCVFFKPAIPHSFHVQPITLMDKTEKSAGLYEDLNPYGAWLLLQIPTVRSIPIGVCLLYHGQIIYPYIRHSGKLNSVEMGSVQQKLRFSNSHVKSIKITAWAICFVFIIISIAVGITVPAVAISKRRKKVRTQSQIDQSYAAPPPPQEVNAAKQPTYKMAAETTQTSIEQPKAKFCRNCGNNFLPAKTSAHSAVSI